MRRVRRTEDTPFSILVLGDFRGRGLAGSPTAGDPGWRPVRVTPEDAMELAGLGPELVVRPDERVEGGVRIAFEGLEDFHPDALFRRLPLFEELRRGRSAAEAGRVPEVPGARAGPEGGPSATDREDPGPAGSAGGEGDGDSVRGGGAGGSVLESILEGKEEPPGGGEGGIDPELREFVREVVEPHLVRPDPDREARIAAVDRAAGELMRVVLHDPGFRELESLWRSVVFLLANTDTSGKVRTYLADVTRGELAEDLRGDGGPARSRLGRLLSEPDPPPPGGRWGLVVGSYTFGGEDGSEEDAVVLERVASAARGADVPWISGADPRLAGWTSPDPHADPARWDEPWSGAWDRIPGCEGAGWLALALPRFLLREPFGPGSSRRCRAFDFREEPEGGVRPGERPLLWGNPAFVSAVVLARRVARRGWGYRGGEELDVGQVPMAPPFADDDRTPVITERRLSRDQAVRLAESGFIPVAAFPREARIRVGGIRPVAREVGRIEAWWKG